MPGDGDEFKKVNAGDPLLIPHNTFNTLMDMATAFKRGQRNQAANAVSVPGLDPGLCYIQNNSGDDLDQFAVVGLDVPVVLPSDNLNTFSANVCFSGLTPDVDDHYGKFAILLEPTASGNVAIAVVAGVCPVLLNVTAAGDLWADVDDGTSDDLLTGSGTAQILWKEGGTGSGLWGIVRLGNLPTGILEGVLVQNGGTNGGISGGVLTTCDFTYDVWTKGSVPSTPSGKKLGTAVTVQRPRAWPGPVTAATGGYYDFAPDGTVRLLEAWEVFGGQACAT